MLDRVTNLVSWATMPKGSPATPLSLTADDGTWIKLPDFKGHLNVVLVFFRSLSDDQTDVYLRKLERERERFEALETAIFGVNTSRTDALRAYRNKLGIQFFLLYDPLAMAARGFRASGRIRPYTKDQVVVVGKDGNILFHERAFPDVETLIEVIARADGKEAPPRKEEVAEVGAEGRVRNPGAMPANVRDIDSQQAMAMLAEADSPYILVDVRTKAEVEREHSPLVKFHIPVDELPHRYSELGQTTHVVFVCQGGGRSAAAAEFMTSIGASQIFNVVGGMSEWTGPKVAGPLGATN